MSTSITRGMSRGLLLLVILGLCLAGPAARASGDLKLEAQLVWGTNDEKAPNPKLKPVETDVRKKLAELPLRWTNFFEINRKQFDVPRGKTGKTSLSEKCAVEVKSLEGKKVEVVWFDKKGDMVGRQSQPLGKGELIVLGGNAPNSTCWLLTLKRLE